MDKTNPNRFSLQFNKKSSTESYAIRVLNDQPPRKRARYVADAIAFYEQRHDSDYINALAEAIASRLGSEMKSNSVPKEYEVGKKRRGRPPKMTTTESSVVDNKSTIFSSNVNENNVQSPGEEKKGGIALEKTDPVNKNEAEASSILDDEMLAGMNALLG